MSSDSSRVVIIALVIAALLGGGAWWWKTHQKAPTVATVATPVSPPPPAPPAVVPALPPPAPPEPAIRYPVPKAGKAELPALEQSDGFVKKALTGLLGRRALQTFLVDEGILRKLVATVDSLGRDHAPSEMWPVVPTPGRFQAQNADQGAVMSSANSARYAPFVSLATGVDARRLVALYHRLYPRLQQAYEELGYPDKYFNDRVVEVLDLLLATPDATQPLALKAVEVPGASPSKKPSLYLYADPAMEARPMGQRILLRMGPANVARVKGKLAELRRLVASSEPAHARP